MIDSLYLVVFLYKRKSDCSVHVRPSALPAPSSLVDRQLYSSLKLYLADCVVFSRLVLSVLKWSPLYFECQRPNHLNWSASGHQHPTSIHDSRPMSLMMDRSVFDHSRERRKVGFSCRTSWSLAGSLVSCSTNYKLD